MTGRPIAFMTDLGMRDDAVGLCKGLMLGISPDSAIVDITHEVTPFDVEEGAQYLQDPPAFFPDDTVFCCFIYPETGSSVPMVAIENDRGQIYVGPDNGLFTHALEESGLRHAYRVENPTLIRQPATPTFLGRDVLVPCAAHLAAGFPIDEVGSRVEGVVRLSISRAFCDDGSVCGKVTVIDKNFGNVWTNITRELLQAESLGEEKILRVKLDGVSYEWPLARTFSDVPKGSPLIYFNSRNRLSFGLNQGDLTENVQVARGLDVRISRCR